MLWLIIAGGVVIVVGWFSWWWPKWEVNRRSLTIRDAKARADIEDNFRKTIGQFFGGATVLVGAGIAYNQTQLTSRASYEQLISQQVSKGFEQLGSENFVVRLGGIYALEGVMNTSERYHQPVLEALCAFVRYGTKTDTAGTPATDIQATLTVIGRLGARTKYIDLSGAHVSNANLFDADLSGANLRDVDLRHADLRFAKLFGAHLEGAHLNNAKLTGADLRDAELTGADLRDAHLEGADLRSAYLLRTDLTNANLSNAIVAQNQLDKACSDGGTTLPSGLVIKSTCP